MNAMDVLGDVWNNPGSTPAEIARRLGERRERVEPLLTTLIEAGLVSGSRPPGPGRPPRYWPSTKSLAAVFDEYDRMGIASLESAFSDWEDPDDS